MGKTLGSLKIALEVENYKMVRMLLLKCYYFMHFVKGVYILAYSKIYSINKQTFYACSTNFISCYKKKNFKVNML